MAYLTKNNKILTGSPAVATAQIVPKIYQGQSPTVYSEYSRFHPNRFTIGGVIAKRVNTAKTRHRVNPIFGEILFEPNNNKKSSGDEIANVNFFTTISHTYFKTSKREPISFNKLDDS